MTIMSSSRIQTIDELVGDSFEWGIAPIPTVNASDVGGAYPSGSGLYMIDRDDEKKKNASWEFLSYMISPEAQAMWVDKTGYTPVNIKAQELEVYKKALESQPKLQKSMDNLVNTPDTIVPAFVPNSSTIGTTIKDTMMAFGSGSISKDEAYKQIVDGIEKSIEIYYRANPID